MLPVKRRRGRGEGQAWPLAPLGDVDSFLDRFWNGSWPSIPAGVYDVDVWDDASHVYVEAELPGISKDDIDIRIEGGVLTIQGEKKTEEEKKEKGMRLQERRYGSFSRSFTLPSTVDTEKVNATLKEGVLRIVLNKTETAKAKQIQVKDG